MYKYTLNRQFNIIKYRERISFLCCLDLVSVIVEFKSSLTSAPLMMAETMNAKCSRWPEGLPDLYNYTEKLVSVLALKVTLVDPTFKVRPLVAHHVMKT